MHCGKCNHPNPDAARFCNQCGAALSAPVAPEYKRLTVLFSDLVGSVEIASRLDPEDWHALLGEYQAAVGGAVQRHEGHVAQHLGDGLVAYFGYPVAGEDDAARAVRAALDIVAVVQRLELPAGVPRLRVRVGLHTGPAVMGEVGSAGHRETLALGDTPNIAARLQALAPPDGVVISATTHGAVQGEFRCLDLGEQTLKGLAQPMRLHQVLAARSAEAEEDGARAGRLPLLGRQAEMAQLLQAWQAARAGQGGSLLLQGEPGIGKSRLARELRGVAVHDGAPAWLMRCSRQTAHTPFAPMVQLLARVAGDDPALPHEERAMRLRLLLRASGADEGATLAPLAALLAIRLPDDAASPPLSAQALRERTFEAATTLMLTGTAERPGLLIAEDLQWADPTTLSWLGRMVTRPPRGRLMLLLTARADFQPPWSAELLPRVTLGPCPSDAAGAMVRALDVQGRLGAAVIARIEARSEGNPLCIEEFTRAALEAGGEEVPISLQQQTQARIDRLGGAKPVLQQAAVIGRHFSRRLLQAVCALDEPQVAEALRRGVEAHLLTPVTGGDGELFAFRHALLQDAAYASLLRSARQGCHLRVAQAMQATDPQTCEQHPELLAHHFAEAGQSGPAIAHGLRAAQLALARSACLEAAAHSQRALALLAEAPSAAVELELQLVRAPALLVAHGVLHPEVEQAYHRARQLCESIGSTPKLLVPLWGLWAWELMRGHVADAHALSQRIGTLAAQASQPLAVLVAAATQGMSLFYLGRPADARVELARGIALYRPPAHAARTVRGVHDPGAMCHAFDMLAAWMLGDEEAAEAGAARLRAMTPALAPYDAAFAWCADGVLCALRGDPAGCGSSARRAAAIAEEQAFTAWETLAELLQGYSQSHGGEAPAGLARMQRALDAWTATGARNLHPLFLALLADGHATQGDAAAALRTAQAGLDAGARAESCWNPELLRLKAMAQARLGEHEAAMASVEQSLSLARAMGAGGWQGRTRASVGALERLQPRGLSA